MLIDIFFALLWVGGAKLAFVDYKAPLVKAALWPFFAGRHMSFYVFGYKTLAEVYHSQQEKERKLH